MNVESCIFDLYGTLVDIHTDEEQSGLWREMAAYYTREGAKFAPDALKVRFRAICRNLERGAQLCDAHEAHPEIRIEEVFLALYAEKGVKADLPQAVRAARHFRECSTEYIRLYDGAIRLLERLRAAGKRIYLLSNAQRVFTLWELEQLGLMFYFDGVLISSDCGIKKPDKRFFDLLLRRYNIDAKTAVMIGNDGRCDIEGGRRAGLTTIYLRSNISPQEPLPPADYAFETMDYARIGDILLSDD